MGKARMSSYNLQHVMGLDYVEPTKVKDTYDSINPIVILQGVVQISIANNHWCTRWKIVKFRGTAHFSHALGLCMQCAFGVIVWALYPVPLSSHINVMINEYDTILNVISYSEVSCML